MRHAISHEHARSCRGCAEPPLPTGDGGSGGGRGGCSRLSIRFWIMPDGSTRGMKRLERPLSAALHLHLTDQPPVEAVGGQIHEPIVIGGGIRSPTSLPGCAGHPNPLRSRLMRCPCRRDIAGHEHGHRLGGTHINDHPGMRAGEQPGTCRLQGRQQSPANEHAAMPVEQ